MSAIFGETLVLGQENGPPVELVVWGDEFYVRYETKCGYTVQYDHKIGRYCYVDTRQGRFVSTHASCDKKPPVGLRRHIQESPEIQRQRFEARYEQIRPREIALGNDNIELTFGPNQGLLSGRQTSQGDILGLTILVDFDDVHADVSSLNVNAMLNNDDYSANGNYCSVKRYFEIASSGKLRYTNHLVGPVTLPRKKSYYETHTLIPDAFALAMDELDKEGFDLARFDSKNEGMIDAVNFIYAGGTIYGINGNNNNPSELWPHNSVVELTHAGYRTHFYMISSLGRRAVDLSIGTFCHESGHLLCRFPDLYDYGRRDGDYKQSRGIGRYCLMGGGNHLNNGRTPSPVCAYLRDLVGWSESISLNGPGIHQAHHGHYNTVFKYHTESENEYFLVENRSQMGLDRYLPASGLAVYHCDRNGSNEWQFGTPTRHYQVALLQADGRRDLEDNLPGDPGDLFANLPGIALSHDTQPSSRLWDQTDSGFILSDISEPSESMGFTVGRIQPANVIHQEVIAHRLIPDNDPQGISVPIHLEQQGHLTSLSVSIDITHSYIGDLEVSLISPAEERAILHDREGGWRNDIRVTYDDSDSKLSVFAAAEVHGNWILQVRDLEGQDIGRLNRWSIDATFESSDATFKADSSPKLAIPDRTFGGVADAIRVAESGKVKDLKVQVDISHTYIGDLHVELVAPSGHSAILHNQTGSFHNDLKVTYDRESAPALETLVNESINGDWLLRVRDLQQADVGRLENWRLELTYGK